MKLHYLLLCLASIASAQDPPEDVKELFFKGIQDRDIKVKAVSQPRSSHLGVRYNLLRVEDIRTRAASEVDPEHNFRSGDCVLLRFMPNRDGFIYLLNQGSSGAWTALLPSARTPDEPNTVRAGVETTIPMNYCLRVDDPPGVENLTAVITTRREEVDALSAAIRGGATDDLARVMARLTPMSVEPKNLASRDLTAVRLSDPISKPGGPPKAVYVVSTLVGASDTLTLKLRIRHQ